MPRNVQTLAAVLALHFVWLMLRRLPIFRFKPLVLTCSPLPAACLLLAGVGGMLVLYVLYVWCGAVRC